LSTVLPFGLKDETLRMVALLAEREGREMTAREESETINPADYWVVEHRERGTWPH
jgi:hypothetical protein